MIKSISRKFSKNPFQYNSYFNIGISELMYSMIHFDPRIASFNTYLYNRVSGKIKHLIRKETIIKDREGNIEKNYTEHREKNDDKILIEEIFNLLNNEEKMVLKMYYIENNTLQEVCDKTNISVSNIYNIKNRAINRVREKLGISL